MPIYEYECGHCQMHFELKQSFNDEPVGTCPECGGAGRRILQPTAIIFKGSGFHSTDYRKSGEPVSPASKGGEPAKEPAASAPDSSPSKSAGD